VALQQLAWQELANLREQQASSLAYFDTFWLFGRDDVRAPDPGSVYEALCGRESGTPFFRISDFALGFHCYLRFDRALRRRD